MQKNIIAVVGKSNSGKTTLLEKLIRELTDRGYRIGTAKHTHHESELDTEGKDTWRHRRAGAFASLLITDRTVALIREDESDSAARMEKYLGDADIILAEGFKRHILPKIEIFRTQSGHQEPLCLDDKNLIAFVTDSGWKPDVPVFGIDDIPGIAAFIEDRYLRRKSGP